MNHYYFEETVLLLWDNPLPFLEKMETLKEKETNGLYIWEPTQEQEDFYRPFLLPRETDEFK